MLPSPFSAPLLLAVWMGGCASSGAVPKPFPQPAAPARAGAPIKAPAQPAPTPPPVAGSLVDTALSLRGVPYRNGGTDLSGFDCSGFTQYVFAEYGIALPRDVRQQFDEGLRVREEDVAAGDLIFFTTTARGASHVAIAVDGDRFVHAPSSTGVVRIERLSSRYWSGRFIGARRLVVRAAD